MGGTVQENIRILKDHQITGEFITAKLLSVALVRSEPTALVRRCLIPAAALPFPEQWESSGTGVPCLSVRAVSSSLSLPFPCHHSLLAALWKLLQFSSSKALGW